ncbi:GNAT family N-acetyltransferase [Dactylosporangium vinaceum]
MASGSPWPGSRVVAAGRPDLRYGSRRNLESLCWVGANLIPVHATTTAAIAAFAEMVAGEPAAARRSSARPRRSSGSRSHLAPTWGPSRDVRPNQPPHGDLHPSPSPPPDPAVPPSCGRRDRHALPGRRRHATPRRSASPDRRLAASGSYRERIAELIRARRAYARFHNGRVIFKAELAVVTKHTAQIQGVWTDPELRGHGLATAASPPSSAMRCAGRTIRSACMLNDYNLPAPPRVYERCGFQQVGTFRDSAVFKLPFVPFGTAESVHDRDGARKGRAPGDFGVVAWAR